jgi:hypothetical protein
MPHNIDITYGAMCARAKKKWVEMGEGAEKRRK